MRARRAISLPLTGRQDAMGVAIGDARVVPAAQQVGIDLAALEHCGAKLREWTGSVLGKPALSEAARRPPRGAPAAVV